MIFPASRQYSSAKLDVDTAQGVIAGLRVGVAVVHVPRVAAEQGTGTPLLIGAVNFGTGPCI